MMDPVPLEVYNMYCEVHERPKDMDCEICSMPLCKECAEFVEGGWLCHDCARRERHAVLIQFDPYRRELAAVGSSSTALLNE
jgi:hypothetical protein